MNVQRVSQGMNAWGLISVMLPKQSPRLMRMLSIRDLGKYQEQFSCPRPILVSFNRAIDVSTFNYCLKLARYQMVYRDMTNDKTC